MKAEINNENKAKFLDLYIGQESDNSSPAYSKISRSLNDMVSLGIGYYAVKLKPLSSISDEDARVIAEQNRFKGNYDAYPKVGRDILKRVFELKDPQMCLPMESADYLRLKGYAVPFMELSVDEMVDANWIKLSQ
jgi:hypothetical protein